MGFDIHPVFFFQKSDRSFFLKKELPSHSAEIIGHTAYHTPWKINIEWNLQLSHLERNIIFHPPPWLCFHVNLHKCVRSLIHASWPIFLEGRIFSAPTSTHQKPPKDWVLHPGHLDDQQILQDIVGLTYPIGSMYGIFNVYLPTCKP